MVTDAVTPAYERVWNSYYEICADVDENTDLS